MRTIKLTNINKSIKGFSNVAVVILTVLLTAVIVSGAIFIWQNSTKRNSENDLQKQIATLEDKVKSLEKPETVNTETPPSITNPGEEKEKPNSSLTSIDQTWDLYTNNKYGFSIKVPKNIYHNYGSMCEWKTDSYRPKGGIVPVKVFEDEKVYISSEYFYELTGETEKNSVYYYSGCEKVINSLSYLTNSKYFQQQSWDFLIKTVTNDAELEKFIQTRYGNGCKLGDKTSSNQSGVYDVYIKGDGKELEETECPINYMTVLKYYPVKNIVISWNPGQASTFIADENHKKIYDEDMIESFRFL